MTTKTELELNHSAVLNVCRKQLDIPVHKVKYALTTGLLNGAFKSLENYGIELNGRYMVSAPIAEHLN